MGLYELHPAYVLRLRFAPTISCYSVVRLKSTCIALQTWLLRCYPFRTIVQRQAQEQLLLTMMSLTHSCGSSTITMYRVLHQGRPWPCGRARTRCQTAARATCRIPTLRSPQPSISKLVPGAVLLRMASREMHYRHLPLERNGVGCGASRVRLRTFGPAAKLR